MEAGRELDALVAERIMGWTKLRNTTSDVWVGREPENDEPAYVPRFSRDIAAAWQVVQRLTEQGYSVNIGCGWYDRLAGAGYGVVVKKQIGNSPTPFHQIVRMEKEGGAPLAICLAALQAVGVEVEV